ncbi:SDR family oxidoreductase [Clostridium sp. SHJSY1]|nr:SDR family oxidoreductase [Clostridium sp. SHJSY1]
MMNKKVLITGGNKGIGLETTRLFLKNNYKVIVVARDFKNFEFNDNNNVEKIEFDVSNIKDIGDLVSKIGHVDVLVNNAGIMNSIPYENYSSEKINTLMDINLYAPIEFIKEVSRSMIITGNGRIINTASVAGQIGHPDIWYGVSKAGIINATKSFAKLLGPKGIVINAVAPGPVETDMLSVIPEQRKKDIKNSVFTDRFAKAEEVAKAIYWLATDCPEYINGTCIDINNGAFPR